MADESRRHEEAEVTDRPAQHVSLNKILSLDKIQSDLIL